MMARKQSQSQSRILAAIQRRRAKVEAREKRKNIQRAMREHAPPPDSLCILTAEQQLVNTKLYIDCESVMPDVPRGDCRCARWAVFMSDDVPLMDARMILKLGAERLAEIRIEAHAKGQYVYLTESGRVSASKRAAKEFY